MPIRFRYHRERDLLIHIGDGPISIADIETLREERGRSGVPPAVRHTLTDMRRAHFDFDITTLREHEKGVSKDELAGSRHAEIAADARPTAMLMLWKKWLPKDVFVEVFSTPQAAYTWLGVEQIEGDLDF